jgi:hypothetical protein
VIRPTTQRVTGWPDGECVRAAYSALLDIPIEQIPPLDPGTAARNGQEQGDRERVWLASIGFNLIEIAAHPDNELAPEVLDCIPENMTHLMSGISPRGFGHRCVGIGGRLAWDPHPSREGLLTVYAIGILVPL